MTTFQSGSRIRKAVAYVLMSSMVIATGTPTVYGAPTALSDTPIAAKVQAKPNIVYTVDDSGSMANNFIPDFVTASTYPAFCRAMPAVETSPLTLNPYYGTNSGNNVTMGTCGAGSLTAFNFPPFYAADFNRLAYNPSVTYQPPVGADGQPLTNSIGTVTDKYGNQINLAKVQSDPYNSPGTTVDLTQKVSVPLYCNSDWPIISNPVVAGEVGDANGEYWSGAGGHCRINGTQYKNAGTGAADIAANYNYPWPKVGTSAGAKGVPNAKDYFWRQNSQRVIWCDKTHPDWPQTCNGGWDCTKGGKFTAPTAQPQTCYLQSTTPKVCTSSPNVYTPAGCNTDPAYDLGGCVAGQEQSCLTCVVTNPCVAWDERSNGACHLTANGGPPGTGGSGAACNCIGVGCTLPKCSDFNPTPTDANCSKGVLTKKCSLNAGRCDDFAFDPVTLTNRSYKLLDDSNLVNGGNGVRNICRHNNFDYGGGAKPDNYPSGLFISPIQTACPTDIPTTATIPRHYYTISSVEFCPSVDGTANGQWNGFGTGTCQTKNDFSTNKWVKYGTFTRVDLVNDGRVFPYTDAITGVASSRTYTEEAINYGNWYAYYRTRILAAKTTSAIAFSFLDDTYRVGFHDFGTGGSSPPAPIWVDVGDFKGTATGDTRYEWYKALFGISIANYSTYTMSAMLRIGNLFAGNTATLSGVNPLPSTAKDPIILTCQNNYHILITDGFTNQPSLPTIVGERDDKVPAITKKSGGSIQDYPPENVLPNLDALVGQAWPAPFVQDSTTANTLSDIATYYWARDLRPSMLDNVPAVSGKGTADLDPTKDVAWWQHLNFSAISFGSEGVLDASQRKATLAKIKAGTLKWGDLTNPNSPINPTANKGAAGVDDLWHATVMGRGQFVYAKTPIEVSYGLASILAGISNQPVSRVGASFTGQVLDPNNNIIYESKINPGWAGEVLKVEIDPTTGKEVKTHWQAAAQLTTLLTPTVADPEPWFTKRKIVTMDDSNKGVPFIDTKLSAGQLASLSSNATLQKKIIAYLRGGNTYSGKSIEGTNIGEFRQRFGPLGDVNNAQPAVASPTRLPDSKGTAGAGIPTRPYLDSNDKNYSGFVDKYKLRNTNIYVAANDGMVHAFDGATGDEVFAYIPKALFRGTAGNVATEDVTAIQALTYQDGGAPIYHHHQYVDSSPRIADVDFTNGAGGVDDWHTILVGGLGKGGNSYYALDITNPAAKDEAAAAAKVLWEWSDPDTKYTYGRPVIVKTRAFGWVVIVTSGYNNVSGEGILYFLDPATGKVLKTMKTGAGTAANPSGFAQIHAFVKDYRNQVAEQVYGGDLLGNLWRFDVSDPDSSKWSVVAFAKLTDPKGNPQPVTTAPQIEIDLNNGVDRFVFIGTGQLLDASDFTNPNPAQQQTMYAIRDGSLQAMDTVGPFPIAPRSTMQPINSDGVSAITGGAPNGWYHDLPTSPNERIVTDVQADVNITLYAGTQAPNDPCVISLPANVYARDYTTGRSLLLDSGGNLVASILFDAGAVGLMLTGRLQSDGTQSLGGIVSYGDPTKGGVAPINLRNPIVPRDSRLSWKILTGE